jgi:GntR family transcriptional regulator
MTAAETGEPLPLYHRVYLLLRQHITEGAWTPDQPMPGEHELAETHGVSRITVRRALQKLEQEGLVLRRRGAGTYARPPQPPKRRENLRGLLENLLTMGLHTKVKLMSFAYVAAPVEVAAALEIPVGTIVQKSVRLRSVRGVPFSHLTTWVPQEIGSRYGAEDLAARPLLHLLEEAGARAARAEQVISAKLADSAVAPLLRVEAGSALLWVRRQVRDASGRVIEAIEALYRPEMYEYQIAMVRERGMWDVRQEKPSSDVDAAV